MQIHFQTANKTKFIVEAEENTTVLDAKKEIESKMDKDNKIAAEDQMFVFSGKILNDGDKIMAIENIKEGSCVFLLRRGNKEKKAETINTAEQAKKTNTAAFNNPMAGFTNPTGGFNNPMGGNTGFNTMAAGLGVDNIKLMIDQMAANPEMLDKLIDMQLGNIAPEQREHYKAIFTEQMREVQRNPERINDVLNVMANNRGAFDSFGMRQPPMQYAQPAFGHQEAFVPSTTIPCSHGFYPYMPYFGPYTPPMAPTQNFIKKPITDEEIKVIEEMYPAQIKSLKEMGFSNLKSVCEVLRDCNGDLQTAVDTLLSRMNK